MSVLKVGIVASGMMAKNHADALRRIPGVQVVAIADPFALNLADIAQELGIPATYTSYEKMCECEDLDVIHNCAPNNEHFAINKYAITHGIGVFSEKPLAVTVDEAEELCELVDKYKVPNGVNFNYRSNAVVREIRARIRNGTAGKPLLVHGAYLQDWLMYDNDYNWRLDSGKGGKSRTVADIGSHWFDTVQTALDTKIVSVNAKLITVYPERLKPAAQTGTFTRSGVGSYEKVSVDTEDAGMIMVKFANGTFGSVLLSQISGGFKNALDLCIDCAKCSLRWEQEEPDHLIIGDRENGVTKTFADYGKMTDDADYYATLPGGHPVGWADALHNNFRLFYDAVKKGTYKNGEQEFATIADATYIMKIVEACLKSNETNSWVDIDCQIVFQS